MIKVPDIVNATIGAPRRRWSVMTHLATSVVCLLLLLPPQVYAAIGGSNASVVLAAQAPLLLRTVAVGKNPYAVVVDATHRKVFVATEGPLNTTTGRHGPVAVSMLDIATGAVLHTTNLRTMTYIEVGVDAQAMAVDERSARLFVLSRAGDVSGSLPPTGGSVSMLDTRTGKLLGINPVGIYPWGVAVDERTNRAFVTNTYSNTVTLLNATSGTIVRTIAVGKGPGALAVDATRGRVFVANSGDGTVSILDARTGKVLASPHNKGGSCEVAVDRRAGRVVVLSQIRYYSFARLLNAATGVLLHTVSLDQGTDCPSSTVGVDEVNGHTLVFTGPPRDSNAPSTVSTFDTRSGRVLGKVAVSSPTGDWVLGTVAVDEQRGLVVAAAQDMNRVESLSGSPPALPGEVSVLDTRSGQIVATAHAGLGAYTVAVDPRTGHAFITNSHDNTVTILALDTVRQS